MQTVEYLVIGAGVTGLAFANAKLQRAIEEGRATPEILILEADSQPGGYCKTIVQDGFTWDYSGHFFHFRDPDIEAWLRARMPGQEVRTVEKHTCIRFGGRDIDFPFQKNIHQLPREDFIDCLVSLYFRDSPDSALVANAGSFKEMLYQRFGRGISERFLIPYNEKLYATDLDALDADAMGRFFPHATIDEIIANMKPKGAETGQPSYNATFSYPLGGAIQFIYALLHDLPDTLVSYSERLVAIDLDQKIATTNQRQLKFSHLVSSAPFDKLCQIAQVEHDSSVFTSNKVVVFNLGFDKKGPTDVHWMYFPDKSVPFYRVGFYDNIMNGSRMSLYVELGARSEDVVEVEGQRRAVLQGLERSGIVEDHTLESWHSVTMDPAYVHITGASMFEHQRVSSVLGGRGVHPAGRYGGWTYCSIEDNIIEARSLAQQI